MKKKIITLQLSNKALIGLRNAGFLDSRNDSVRPLLNLSKLINGLIERYVTGRSHDTLIAYYRNEVGMLNVKMEEGRKKLEEYSKIISELKKDKEKRGTSGEQAGKSHEIL